MRKTLGTVLTVAVFGLIAWRALNTWGYIGGALQPGGGGGRAGTVPLVDAAEVTVESVSGRWVYDPSTGREGFILALYPDKTYEWIWCEKKVPIAGREPERGTWWVDDGWIGLCRPTGGHWLGRVSYLPDRYMTVLTPPNGGPLLFERLNLIVDLEKDNRVEPAERPAPSVPQQMPDAVPPGLPVVEPKPLPTTTPQLPTTGPK